MRKQLNAFDNFLIECSRKQFENNRKIESQKILCNLATGQFGAGEVKPLSRHPGSSQTVTRPTVTEDYGEELQEAWDDVSGTELDPTLTLKARAEEMGFVRELGERTCW